MMLCLKLTLLTLLIAAPGLLLAAQDPVITCDGGVLSLSCGTKLIKVLSTVYGRTDSNTCPPPHPPLTADVTNCQSNIITIAERCNGVQNCEVKTKFLDNNDPCPGTYKYYTTTYECVDSLNLVVCEPKFGTLDCGSNIIDVITANFGTADSTTCSSANPNSMKMKPNCYAPGTLSTVASQCNGQTSCTLQATSTFTFNNVCKNVPKSLTVSYRCTRTLTTCQYSTADLDCGALTIKIISADYGRTDQTTCIEGYDPSSYAVTDCHLPSALSTVQSSCDGLRTCSVPATNEFFTNPCPGTIKYLTIVYLCV